MAEITGWLLDIYPDASSGVIYWLAGEDGQRYRLHQPYQITFYVGGAFPQLRKLWRFLKRQAIPVQLARTRREDLFSGLIHVLAIKVDAVHQVRLFKTILHRFPDLDFYDADIPLLVRFAAETNVFPLTRCLVVVDDDSNKVQEIESLDCRWEIDAPLPDLRLMTIEPDTPPAHRPPQALLVKCMGEQWHIPLMPTRYLLFGLETKLKRFNPDVIMTRYGDTWLFPYLLGQAQKEGLPFHPSREPQRTLLSKKASSYFTYGQVIYRGEQTYLYGRWHIDVHNAMLFSDYRLEGVLEQARVTGMPVQEMARRSPGAGITAMQMITALQRGVLVPYTKQQAEHFKSAKDLIRSDRGGLVFMPEIGLHTDVAEIDFVSMYPSIIDRFNISPETVKVAGEQSVTVPEIGIPIEQSKVGLLPETLKPLLTKRITMKRRLAGWNHQDCRCRPLKSRSNALKWLLVVAFGYAGYKRARFGRIEAHEAITAYSRETMLQAKELAEDAGFEVLHLYVDGLWVKKAGVTRENVQPLLEEIMQRTGLPIALEGIYRWLAFLPSKLDERIPVPNRYFGAFSDKSLKLRGIEARRHDTPLFIADLQLEMLNYLARVPDIQNQNSWRPTVIGMIHSCLAKLQCGQILFEELLISQTLSREIEEYATPSPAARAARQLQNAGKPRYPGQRIQFIYTRGECGVHAWDLPTFPKPESIDTERYTELTLRAVDTVLQPFGIEAEQLRAWALHRAYQLPLF